ncbi:MAG: pentapeptide repeat-containing protein, partial [Thermodesulfobacteriota bacterium]
MNKRQGLTENDFSNNPELRADPRGRLLTTFLEHPDSSTEENDTGVHGRDIIPLTYAVTTSHTFCWKDEDQEAKHFMTLNDINSIEIIRILVNGDCASEIIEPGDY